MSGYGLDFVIATPPAPEYFRDVVRRDGHDYIDFAEVLWASDYCKRTEMPGRPCAVNEIFLDGAHLGPGASDLLGETLYRHLSSKYGIQ